MPKIGRDPEIFRRNVAALMQKLGIDRRDFAKAKKLPWRWFKRVTEKGLTSIEKGSRWRLVALAEEAGCQIEDLWEWWLAKQLMPPKSPHSETLDKLAFLIRNMRSDHFLIKLIDELYELDQRRYGQFGAP